MCQAESYLRLRVGRAWVGLKSWPDPLGLSEAMWAPRLPVSVYNVAAPVSHGYIDS